MTPYFDQSTKSFAGSINAWIQRRLNKGTRPNADDIAAHIIKTWPSLHADQVNAIYDLTK